MKTIVVDKQTNIVTNVIVGVVPDGLEDLNNEYETVEKSFYVGPGFTKNLDGSYSAPYRAPDPIPVPRQITRRQCAIELRERSLITAQEALNMTRNGIPPLMVQSIFDQMQETEKLIAETDFTADTYLRGNVLLNFIMTSTGATSEDIDNFFISASNR